MRQDHPGWGKQRIAHELAKANNWVGVVSPNTVKRILRSASLWSAYGSREKRGFTTVTHTVEEAGQTVNIDLCFMPVVHTLDQKLPAVSGSSGRLIVERLPHQATTRSWPDQVFVGPDQPYAAAMQAF